MKSSTRLAIARTSMAGAVLVLCFQPAAAQGCPELLGRWPYGTARAVAVTGSTAYVSSGAALLVVDVSNPASPQLLGDVILPDVVRGVAVAGDHAYVVDGYDGLRVIDVSVPSAPVEVGILDTPSFAYDVVVAGDYAYVADGSSGLRVISIANPSAPSEVGFVDTPGGVLDVAVAGSYAYVADGYHGGLRVILIANPSSPSEVGFVDTPGNAQNVALAGSHAYVADGDSGLRVISIADPSAPVEVGFVDTPGSALGVAVAGTLAFVADYWGGLRVIDVSNPSAPVEAGSIRPGVQSFGVAAVASLAYVADDQGGLVIVDAAVPSSPTVAGAFPTGGISYAVAVAAGLAYVGVEPPALRVMDVSAPAAPVEVSLVAARFVVLDVVLADSHLFVAEHNQGLEIFDLAEPTAPVSVGVIDTPGEARGVAVAGTFAYVADSASGLRVVDVSVPGTPTEVGFVDTPDSAWGVAVAGDYAYVADQGAGLRVIDIHNPASPIEVGFVDTPDRAWRVAVAGDHAYVADDNSGVRVIDVSVPTAPREVGFYNTPVSAVDIAVVGPWAYVADRAGGLLVLDVSTPAAPELVGSYDTPGDAWRLAVSEGTVVLADYNAGVAVFDDCQGGAPPGYELFVPAAAVAAGAEGAFFSTDLEINNTGTQDAQVDVAWLPRGEDNSAPVRAEAITLAPGRSVRFANVLGELFGLGPDSFGALRLAASTADVIAMSRTYNSPDGKAAGTFGQGLPAVPAAGMISGTRPQRIIFLSENPDSRANVGCVNGSSEPVRVSLAVFDDEGSLLETRSMDLGPYSNDQVNRILRSWAPVNGYVDVSGDSAGALYYCYGSMLDNITSDPTTILPQTPSAEMNFIPAAALAAGLEGAFFQTDLDLNNVGSREISYELIWLPRGADNSDPTRSRRFSLAPGAGVRYANVLDEVFGLEPNQVGALAVEAKGINMLAMSRTYNLPPAKVAGTFGQELAGIPADRMIPTGVKKRIIFMDENGEVRSNVGCQNGGDALIIVTIQLFSPQGQLLETRTMSLPPRSNDQITRVFRDHSPITAGYVDVSSSTPGATFTCYGSVLDNLTSDPTTVPPQ